MGRQVVTDQQAGYGSGLNIVADPAFLRPDQARQMVNFKLSAYGAALKRLGTALTSSTPLTTTLDVHTCGIQWNDTIYVTADSVNKMYLTTYGFPNAMSWSTFGTIIQFYPVVFSDGTNATMYLGGVPGQKVQKFTGSVLTSLGAGTAGVDGLCVYNDRLWGWHGSTLYYSQLSSVVGSTGGDSIGDASAGGGAIVVRTFGGQSDIVFCAPVNGALLIWQTAGVSILTGWGQDDVQVQPQALSTRIGLGLNGTPNYVVVAHVLTTGDTAYFLTPAGVYVTDGQSVRPLDNPEKPDPVAYLLRTNQITLTTANASIAYNEVSNEVWVWINGFGVYVYNVVLAAWSGPLTGTYLNDDGTSRPQVFFPVTPASSGTRVLWRIVTKQTGIFVSEVDSYLGGSTPVYKDDVVPNGSTTGTGGTAVTATLQPHRMFGGNRIYAKSWRWYNIVAQLTTGAAAPTLVTTTQLGGSSTFTLSTPTSTEQSYYVSPGGMGPWIDGVITDAGTTGSSQYVMAEVEGNFLGQR